MRRHTDFYMRKLATLLILWSLCLAAAATGGAGGTKLTIRCDCSFPPFNYIDADGNYRGFNVDFVEAVMSELQMDYDLRLEPWADVMERYAAGEVDLVAGCVFDDPADTVFNYGTSYFKLNYVIVVNAADSIVNLEQLANRPVCMRDTSLMRRLAGRRLFGNLRQEADVMRGLLMVADGSCAAFVCPERSAQYFIKSERMTSLRVLYPGWLQFSYSFAARDLELQQRVNCAVFTLMSNGEFSRIYEKWFVYGRQPLPGWFYPVCGVAAVFVALLVLAAVYFSRKAQSNGLELIDRNRCLSDLLQRYDAIFNNTVAALCFYDADGALTSYNKTALLMFPHLSKAAGRKISIFDNPVFRRAGIVDDKGNVRAYEGLLSIDTRPGHAFDDLPEIYHLSADNARLYYFYFSVQVLRNARGRMTGVIVTSLDRTEDVRASRMLMEEKVKLNLVLESGHISAWRYSPAEKMFYRMHRNAQFVPLRTFDENLALIHPDDREAHLASLRTMLDGKSKIYTDVLRYIQPDGTYRYYEMHSIAQFEQGAVVSIFGTFKDVTDERTRTLRDAVMRTQLEMAIELSGIGVFSYDVDTDLISCVNRPNNDTDLSSMTLAQAVSLMVPEERQHMFDAVERLKTGRSERERVTFRTCPVGGRSHYFESCLAPQRNIDGRVVKIIYIRRNITNVVERQHVVEQVNLKLKLAMEVGELRVWMFDSTTRLFVNIGDKSLNPGGRTDIDYVISCTHPADRAAVRRLHDDILAGRRVPERNILRIQFDSKGYRYWEMMVSPMRDVDGRLAGYIGVQKDITQLVEANKKIINTVDKLKFALKASGIMVWDFDNRSKIFTVYNEIVDSGLRTGEGIDKYMDLVHPDDASTPEWLRFIEVLSNGIDAECQVEVRLNIFAGDEYQYCHIHCIPNNHDSNGNVLNYIGVRQNNTVHVKYQQRLREEIERAQQADRLKSAFLANMSHEIRTPLNAIVGFSELLQTTDDPAERAEFVKIVNTNNELLLRLVGDILDLSKIEAGMIELKYADFDVSDMIGEVAQAFGKRIAATIPGVEFVVDNPYDTCVVNFDRSRLMQIVTNYLTNAIKHTRTGHIRLSCAVDGHDLIVSVEDTGTGIPRSKQSHLFERFAKLDDFSQGTGLGLAICKAIAGAAGGSVGADSEEGRGSTFWCSIPCVSVLPPTAPAEAASPGTASFSAADGAAILVVEPDYSSFALLKIILRHFELTRVTTVAQALDQLRAKPFDAAMVDLQLPGADAAQSIASIRSLCADMPLIGTLFDYNSVDRSQLATAGCNAFITKPYKKSALFALFGQTENPRGGGGKPLEISDIQRY